MLSETKEDVKIVHASKTQQLSWQAYGLELYLQIIENGLREKQETNEIARRNKTE